MGNATTTHDADFLAVPQQEEENLPNNVLQMTGDEFLRHHLSTPIYNSNSSIIIYMKQYTDRGVLFEEVDDRTMQAFRNAHCDLSIVENVKTFDQMYGNPLAYLARKGTLQMLKDAVKKYGVDQLNNSNFAADTCLVLAVISGRDDVVKYVLKNVTDVNMGNLFGKTPLIFAILCNHESIVDILLADKRTDVNKKCHSKRSPLFYACKNKDVKGSVVEKLLAAGADPTASDVKRWTPLMMCAYTDNLTSAKILLDRAFDEIVEAVNLNKNTAQHIAAYYDSYNVLLELKNRKVDMTVLNIQDWTPLAMACHQNNVICAELLLYDNDVDEDERLIAPDKAGMTPLMKIVGREHGPKMAEMILDNYPNSLHAQDVQGNTALIYCAIFDDADVADFLLEDPECDCTHKNNNGMTAFTCAITNDSENVVKSLLRYYESEELEHPELNQIFGPETTTPLCYVIASTPAEEWSVTNGQRKLTVTDAQKKRKFDSKIRMLNILLNARGIDVNAVNGMHISAFQLAVHLKLRKVVNVLIQRNDLKLNAINLEGFTAMIQYPGTFAEDDEDDSIYVLERCLAAGCDVNDTNQYGLTVLIHAAVVDRPDIVQWLLEKGAKIEIEDQNGNTALAHAVMRDNMTIVRMFYEKGGPSIFYKKIQSDLDMLQLACTHLHKRLVDFMIDEVDMDPNRYGSTLNPLSLATTSLDSTKKDVAKNVCDVVAKLLTKMPEAHLINFKYGMCPFIEGCRKKNPSLVALLIEHKFDVNKQYDRNVTPLHTTVCMYKKKSIIPTCHELQRMNRKAQSIDDSDDDDEEEDEEVDIDHIIRMLLAAGANVSLPSHDDLTPLLIAAIHAPLYIFDEMLRSETVNWNYKYKGQPMLIYLITNTFFTAPVRYLLDTNKVNINEQEENTGFTALHHIVTMGHVCGAQLLMEYEADRTIEDASLHLNPIQWAIRLNQIDIFFILVDNGGYDLILPEAAPKILEMFILQFETKMIHRDTAARFIAEFEFFLAQVDLNEVEDEHGQNALHIALKHYVPVNEDLMMFLLKHKCDFNKPNHENISPSSICKSLDEQVYLNLLQRH